MLRWNPRDFFLDGRYADDITITDAFEEVARQTESTRAIMLASLDGHIFRSLAKVKAEDSNVRDRIQSCLTRVVNEPEFDATFFKKILSGSIRTTVDGLKNEEQDHPTLIAKLCVGVPSQFKAWSTLKRLIVHGRKLNLGMLFLSPEVSEPLLNLDWLSTCIAASVPISIRLKSLRDSDLQVRMRCASNSAYQEMRQATSSTAASLFDAAPYALQNLKVLAEICGAKEAALILYNRQQQDWVSFTSSLDSSPTLARIKEHSLAEVKAIRFVVERRRPLLFNASGVSTDYLTFAALELKEIVSPSATAICIHPVPIRSFEQEESVVGGILLVVSEASPGLTAQDYSVIERSSKEIGALFDNFVGISVTNLLYRITQDRKRFQPHSGSVDEVPSGFPPDVAPAVADIQTYLESAARLTHSSSATMRLVDFGSSKLVRKIAFPNERMNDGYQAIEIDGKGITAEVAREGAAIYVNDIPNSKKVLSIPERMSRSEIALPVSAGGRIVAVLNFESRAFGAYEGWISFFELIASAISQRLEICRREFEQTALSEAAHVVESLDMLHDLSGQLEYLSTQRGVSLKLSKSAGETARRLRGIYLMREESPFPAGFNVSVVQLVQKAFEPLHASALWTDSLKLWFDDSSEDRRKQEFTVDSRTANRVFRALTNIVSNLEKYASSLKGIRVERKYERLAGHQHVLLKITSKTNSEFMIPPQTLLDAYRVVIKKQGERSCLGCFLVGCLMRGVGGDAYADGDNDTFITHIDFPVGEAS